MAGDMPNRRKTTINPLRPVRPGTAQPSKRNVPIRSALPSSSWIKWTQSAAAPERSQASKAEASDSVKPQSSRQQDPAGNVDGLLTTPDKRQNVSNVILAELARAGESFYDI